MSILHVFRRVPPVITSGLFFVLSKLLDVFLSPLVWAMVLFALAIPWRRSRRDRGWRRRRLAGALGLLVLVVFSLDLVSNAMLHRLEYSVRSTYRPDATYDVVVLLGGVTDERVVAETGEPSYNECVERLIATHRLLAEGRARFAIVSGAAMDPRLTEFGEARVLARQLTAWGIDPSRVILEEQARNTRENAVYTARIVAERGWNEAVIVTSAFHMPRSIECFRAVGMTFDTLSVDYRSRSGSPDTWLPRTGFLHTSSQVIREVVGLQVYRFQGYAKP